MYGKGWREWVFIRIYCTVYHIEMRNLFQGRYSLIVLSSICLYISKYIDVNTAEQHSSANRNFCHQVGQKPPSWHCHIFWPFCRYKVNVVMVSRLRCTARNIFSIQRLLIFEAIIWIDWNIRNVDDCLFNMSKSVIMWHFLENKINT